MAVAVIDDKCVVTEVNEEFTINILNRRATVGSSFLGIFDENDQLRVRAALSRVEDGGQMEKLDGVHILSVSAGPSGFPVSMPYNVTLVKGYDSGFVGVASREAGTTGTVESSSEAEELKDFFNKAPIALHWLSDSGRVLWANDRELEVLGYSREEYIGANIMDFCPDSKEDVLEIFKQLGTGNTVRDVPVRFRTKAGKIQDLLIDSNVNYKQDGSFNHTRCFIRDDTGRILKEARAAASSAAEKKLSEGKERFSCRLLQAVRTPLHSLSMCMSDPVSIDVPVVAGQLRALTGLLASVSKAMKFDDGYFVKPVPTPCNLFYLVQKYRKVEGVRHEVVVEAIGFNESLVVHADARMIQTVLDELVMHADERSPDGAQVRLTIERATGGEAGGDAGIFEFKVVDNGHELDETRVEKAFHNYWLGEEEDVQDREESPRDSRPCSSATTLHAELSSSEAAPALKLNVAFNYVQCLQSSLRVDSNAERTTFQFTLTLPITQPHQDKTRRDKEGPHRWNKIVPSALPPDSIPAVSSKHKSVLGLYDADTCKHILIAEDNTICQKLCKKIVMGLGHTVDTADNGAIAVEMVGKTINIYDLVLMDVRMPVMDGITAAKRIHKVFPELPIVAFSAEEGQSTIEAALKVMVGFMPKPTNAAGVEETIQKYSRRPLVSVWRRSYPVV